MQIANLERKLRSSEDCNCFRCISQRNGELAAVLENNEKRLCICGEATYNSSRWDSCYSCRNKDLWSKY